MLSKANKSFFGFNGKFSAERVGFQSNYLNKKMKQYVEFINEK